MKRLLLALLFSFPVFANHVTQTQPQTIHVDWRTTAAETIHVDQHVMLQETVTVHYDSAYLSWNASTTGGITGYNVYRGSASGGPYSLLGSVASTVTTYTDSTVLINNTYYYVVTAVAPACPNNGNPCGESGHSNEAKAVMP